MADDALGLPSLPPGVAYFEDFLSNAEEAMAEARLDAGEWSNVLKRRVQHFGYIYDYKARTVTADAYLGKLPDWLHCLAERLVRQGYFTEEPNQVIANEYLPGQGISAHVDCVPCFTDTIVSISLLSQCEMVFREKFSPAVIAVVLQRRSAILLKGRGRYDWSHEIAARKSDLIGSVKIDRTRRISLTFRRVILGAA
ncbi:alpha-ketoglutarate-dependent dioxygenase AlkB [Rhizobium sp. XQZ8]|uniref:alpha-ketoglutarate-dependent dioxygenase AlkB n=1 Tax=Rhizobium populisoli TaxID=2859785 RepID=UPI001CA4B4AF|nr:alpha-ketoglutarate-dependent dioxygenase AlkB [Rhizobium populisoli]MBW6425899.1 alpha-ketoglutarate-dependent dioxygenase AlkB [Rhizobium populisoli]